MADQSARRRAGNKEQSKPVANAQAHTGRTRRLRSTLPREGASTVRWMLTFLVLAVAIMLLAYYVTYNSRVATKPKAKTPPASNSTGTDSEAKKAASSDKKAASSDKKAAKSEKTSDKSGTKKNSKSSEKQKKNDDKKSRKNTKEKVEEKQETQEDPRNRIYRRKTPYIDMNNVDLTDIPVLQWPIVPSDPDRPFIIEILTGEKAIRRRKFKQALQEFEDILARFPQSPRGMFGKAETLCAFAEHKRSNKYLDLCIDAYWNVGIENILTSGDLRRVALLRLADRATFRGKTKTSLRAWAELTRYFPEERHYARQVALLYHTANVNDKALKHFKAIVAKWPDDTFSKAHIGLILKSEGKCEEALPMLLEGLRNDKDVRELAKFYHHTGECLTQLQRHDEAHVLYAEGVSLGHFPSLWQRSLHNEPNLRAQPWWLPGDTGYQSIIQQLEGQWEAIRSETRGLLGNLQELPKRSCDTGDMRQLLLYSNGKVDDKGCGLLPHTCALIGSISAATSYNSGQVKLVAMTPGTVTWPTVAPSNTHLRLHLGLVIPSNASITVANETRSWQEGKVLVFDDSFEYTMQHKGSEDTELLLLSVDVWHPDIPTDRWKSINPV